MIVLEVCNRVLKHSSSIYWCLVVFYQCSENKHNKFKCWINWISVLFYLDLVVPIYNLVFFYLRLEHKPKTLSWRGELEGWTGGVSWRVSWREELEGGAGGGSWRIFQQRTFYLELKKSPHGRHFTYPREVSKGHSDFIQTLRLLFF